MMTTGQTGALPIRESCAPTFSAPPNPVSASTIAGIFTAFAMKPARRRHFGQREQPDIRQRRRSQFAIPAPLT